MILKLSMSTQNELLGKRLVGYYCEWCAVPKVAGKGVAFKDCCLVSGCGDKLTPNEEISRK